MSIFDDLNSFITKRVTVKSLKRFDIRYIGLYIFIHHRDGSTVYITKT